jgi:guanylate kinase
MVKRIAGKGLVIVLVGPSAVGKNTMMSAALKHFKDGLRQLPTATTRPMRNNEREGREHFFHTKESFDRLIEENALLEWQWVHDHRYGIIRSTIEEAITVQNDLIADIEVLGATVLRSRYPDNAVLIFISPPDRQTLEERIRKRAEDNEATIARRLERVPFEMKFATMCHYLIVNDDLETASQQLIAIITAERSRRNLTHLTVAAMFHHEGRVLVREGSAESFPSTLIAPGETPEDALYRLAAACSLENTVIRCQPGTPNDDAAPTHFTVAEKSEGVVITLIFACDVTPIRATPPGWQWKPVETVPLAKTYGGKHPQPET